MKVDTSHYESPTRLCLQIFVHETQVIEQLRLPVDATHLSDKPSVVRQLIVVTEIYHSLLKENAFHFIVAADVAIHRIVLRLTIPVNVILIDILVSSSKNGP